MTAPTGPEPEERHAGYSLAQVSAAEDRGYRRGRAEVSALQADVARLEGERDAARAKVEHWKSRWEAACTRLDEEGAQTVSLLVDKRRLVAERDEARTAWAGALTRLEDVALALGDWRDFQMGARTARGEPQSDAEGSGVAQDVRDVVEAETGVRGACDCPWHFNHTRHRAVCPSLTGSHYPEDACSEWGHRDA